MDRRSGPNDGDKVEAIYALREAVEEKAHAEDAVRRDDRPQTRDALLDATLDVEAKTQDAIETCHDCDRPHAVTEPHEARTRIDGRHDNVVEVEFRRRDER